MISLRQHAFSLAAVFLALAVGVVLGSGFLSDTLLSSLRDEKRDLYTQISGLNDQKNVLNEKLSAANNFDNQLVGRIVHDALAGKTVVVFRTPDAKDDDVAVGVENRGSGRRYGDRNGVADAGVRRRQLRGETAHGGELVHPARRHAVEHQARRPRFAGRRPARHRVADQHQPGHPGRPKSTPRSGIPCWRHCATPASSPINPADHMGAANAAVVITGGALPQDAGNQGVSVARFSAALAPHGSGTLLAGRDGSATGGAAVAVTRADAGMAAAISTVDDVDAAPGRITAILGLHDLINGGHVGQYGTGHGATSITVPQ